MSWFRKEKKPKEPLQDKPSRVPEGLWVKCEGCQQIIWHKEIERNGNVCPKCNYHFRISAEERIRMILDEGAFTELFSEILSVDVLRFRDTKKYKDRLQQSWSSVGKTDAIRVVEGRLGGRPIILCTMEYAFMGGSMGTVVGEKITRAVERTLESRVPLIIISCSGGARMQEGALSLVQMAKISAALARLDEEGIPFISVMTDPTTGGVSASYAMLGDLNVAEPLALIGFAGPRVIEQTIRQKLPDGFQRSEFLLEHGMLDKIVERKDLRDFLIRAIHFMYSAQPV
ncbi:MAG TPA: acetyl-CoA carboxylase, carboxyltransferase subunit beta [Acidobacteriota bacterium]|nr:acetyl-CoA carboxylase, carboxyltransferase subunit beta [Acidobacteriota bacterium]